MLNGHSLKVELRSPKPSVWVQFLLPVFWNMAGVVKWLTHQIVALAYVGSIPITRLFLLIIGVSPSGKARDFDSLMRWFESSYPSYFAGVAELADALDSKSSVRKDVPVRPRPPV